MYSFIWNIPLCLLILSSSVFSHVKQLSYASQFGMCGFTCKLSWGPNSMVSPGHQSQGFQEGPLVWGRCALYGWSTTATDTQGHGAGPCCCSRRPSCDWCRLSGIWDSHPGQETRWGNASPGRRCLPGKVDGGYLFFFFSSQTVSSFIKDAFHKQSWYFRQDMGR